MQRFLDDLLRVVRVFLTVVSAFLCVGLLCLWPRTWIYQDQLTYVTAADVDWIFSTSQNGLCLAYGNGLRESERRKPTPWDTPEGWGFLARRWGDTLSLPSDEVRSIEPHPLEHEFLGFGFQTWQFTLPAEEPAANSVGDIPQEPVIPPNGQRVFGAWAVGAPLWALVPLTGLAPGLAIGRMVRRWREKPGHCAKCGCDLRASEGRCPECGTSIAKATRRW